MVKKAEGMIRHRTCGNCYNWERIEDARQSPGEDINGECLLNPPIVMDVDECGNPMQVNPITAFRSRCGQHQAQEH